MGGQHVNGEESDKRGRSGLKGGGESVSKKNS